MIGFMLVLIPNFNPIFNSLATKEGLMFLSYSLAIATGYVICAQGAKKAYIRIFKSWL
jgi:hypothetical protein